MKPEDNHKAAQNAMQQFYDPRVTQFYDPFQASGKLIAKDLPLNADIAWDIYLFYQKGMEWTDRIPLPVDWMHQLRDTDGDSEHLRCGDDLVKGLHEAMNSII